MPGIIKKRSLYTKVFNSKKLLKSSTNLANRKIKSAKQAFLKDFSSHPVTKEIEGGPNFLNISGTLGGYGNLFSFIGFSKGSNPVSPILNLIQTIQLGSLRKNKNNTYRFRITVPSLKSFYNASRMPWESGRSWLFDIEKGISGLGSYLYLKYESSKSRSGSGIQISKNYRKIVFKPVNYFNTMYNKFIIRVSK